MAQKEDPRQGREDDDGEGQQGTSDTPQGNMENTVEVQPYVENRNAAVEEQRHVYPLPGRTLWDQAVQQPVAPHFLVGGRACRPPSNDFRIIRDPMLYPLPGRTLNGQALQQCSDPGGIHFPIGGIACHPPSRGSRFPRNTTLHPLPGQTLSGQAVQQCSDPGGIHFPIGGIACPPPSRGFRCPRDPMENDCTCQSCRNP